MLLQHIGNICLFFVSVNIVINYWEYLVLGEYLVPNIVISYVITTYWEYLFFFC